MKTRGIDIVEGFLVLRPYRSVPDAFWARLQHVVAKARLSDEYRSDRMRSRDGEGSVWEREERLFRRWVERLAIPVALWPWERGWTEEAVDSYLLAQASAEVAA